MFEWKVKDKKATNAIFLAETGDDEGRPFKSRFLQAGLVKYDFGVCLLKKETIDKFVNTFINQPVIIGHKDDIKQDDIVGYVHNIWFSPEDGWFWCDGKLTDKEAIKKVEKGFNVSCQYRITEYSNNTDKKLHNGNPYDKEILSGIFEHLAIVENPRYEDAFIAVNAYIAENEDRWITIKPNGEENKGRHLLLKDGETPGEAIQRVYGNGKQSDKEEKNKYLKKGDLETDKVYKLGNLYVKPFVDDDGDLAFYDRTGAWGEGSVAQKFLKSDLKNLERAEKYDKLTDKELKFLSEKGDFNFAKREDKQTDKEEKREPFTDKGKSKLYEKLFTTEVEKELRESVKAQQYENKGAKVGDTVIDSDKILSKFSSKLSPEEYKFFDWEEAEEFLFDKLKKIERETFKKETATNSFVEQFKDMLYETLAEGIYERLGELKAVNFDESKINRDEKGRFAEKESFKSTSQEEKQKKIDSVNIDITKDNILPELNKEEQSFLGIENYPVRLKKAIIERNQKHNDVNKGDDNYIIGSALYNPEIVIPAKTEGYYHFIKRVYDNKNSIVLLDVNVNKNDKYLDIVHYYYTNDKGRRRTEKNH